MATNTRSGGPSRKRQNAVVGVHAQDRLYRDRKYRQKFLEEAGPAQCIGCGALTYAKHWFIDADKAKEVKNDSKLRHVFCPGCHRIQNQMYYGEVVLESPTLVQNKSAVMGLIKHTELKCWYDNPMSRIAKISDLGSRIEITTTTTWLARRIGKVMHKAYKGDLKIKPSPAENFVRVHWLHSEAGAKNARQ